MDGRVQLRRHGRRRRLRHRRGGRSLPAPRPPRRPLPRGQGRHGPRPAPPRARRPPRRRRHRSQRRRDVGTFNHLLTSLAELDLDTVSSRSEADQALQGQIPDPVVRGFLLQNLRPSAGGYSWRRTSPCSGRACRRSGASRIRENSSRSRPERRHSTVPCSGWPAPNRTTSTGSAAHALVLPRTTLLTVKGSGHWVHSEKPEAFVTAVRTFLTRPEYAG